MQTRPTSVNYAHHTDQEEPVVLIVGVGQTGLSLGARLKQLNISTILIEQVFPLTYISTILTRATARTTGSVTTGESGTRLLFCMVSALYIAVKRTISCVSIADPVWFDHLPYVPFPDHWPKL